MIQILISEAINQAILPLEVRATRVLTIPCPLPLSGTGTMTLIMHCGGAMPEESAAPLTIVGMRKEPMTTPE